MNTHEISDAAFLNQVQNWIDSDGVIYADVYVFHAPFPRLVTSYRDFEELISIMEGRGEITVLRHPDYLLKGIATTDLLIKAVEAFPEGKEWKLLCEIPNHGARGRTHQELKEVFERKNKYVAICSSADRFPPSRSPRNNEEILVARFK
jgi:hypothetical protein